MAAPHGNAQAAMSRDHKIAASLLRNLEAEPWRFDYFTVLRHLERVHEDQPRIGDSATRRDEFVLLGQDPFMDFPASNLARVEQADDKPPEGLRQISRHARPAGRVAACDDRGGLSLHPRQRRRVSALPGHFQSSLSAIVLPRLGGFAADRPARPPEAGPLLRLCRLGDRPRLRTLQEPRQHPGRRQARLCRPVGSPGEIRLASRRRPLRSVRGQSGGRGVRRNAADARRSRMYDSGQTPQRAWRRRDARPRRL